MGAMRVGVSWRSGHGLDDVRAGVRWMVERAGAARAAGLDSLFVGDHHVAGGPHYQNSPILGRLLAEWDSEQHYRDVACQTVLVASTPFLPVR